MTLPPPPGTALSYLEQLRHNAEERRSEAEELHRLQSAIAKKKLELELEYLSSPTTSGGKRQPADTYETQLTAWFNRLPLSARLAPRTMEELLNVVTGRTPGMRAHPGEVSKVLTKMGWRRRRHWKADGEGRRLWWPPGGM